MPGSVTPANLHLDWCWHLFDVFVRFGVTDVVISPGSRSTPLVIAAESHPGLRKHLVVDERCAAFFGLGLSRLSGNPSVLICTSGTAAAHYFPAVIEAHHAGIPLIALTADRPFELIGAGESQTIDQTRLFGTAVREFFELSVPEQESFVRLRRRAAQAVIASVGANPGPVHINARFRKPFEAQGGPWAAPSGADDVFGYVGTEPTLPTEALRRVADLVNDSKCPAFVFGPAYGTTHPRDESQNVGSIWPVFAEISSDIFRYGLENVIHSLQWAANVWKAVPASAPDLVVECGMVPVSDAYRSWVADNPHIPRVVVHPADWVDPIGTAGVHIRCHPTTLLSRLSEVTTVTPSQKWYTKQWIEARDHRRVFMDGVPELFPMSEIGIAHCVVRGLPETSNLIIGNSLVIRDVDLVGFGLPRSVRVFHQRGAAGIDGLVSGAAGVAHVSRGPTTLMLGDLSFLHDLGGLAVARHAGWPLVVVVFDNGGGRIFESLPIAQHPENTGLFHRYFVAPPDVDFLLAAAAFGISSQRVDEIHQLKFALQRAYATPGCTLIVATIDRAQSQPARRFVNQGDEWATK
ncbi:MAG: 2-succinyl-5-enolpyruvyl-6-hydroxy-3-cyclohexene-1-carboxylic-acid synthase [Myxococcales bacterium]|nr:2-succinyl-5-enolpyruvyl-6-hydroxy-3-cyclohexene-1-carboxylic-acid synthase [Myxococcales bacterium]